MKNTIIVFFIAPYLLPLQGQELLISTPMSLISSGGGIGSINFSGDEKEIIWTLGETIIGDGGTGNLLIHNGEQQGIAIIDQVMEFAFRDVKVYPNPAGQYVVIENLPDGPKSILLTDISGRIIKSIKTNGNAEILNTTQLSPGMYSLVISNESTQSLVVKVIVSY